jgi:hypothetical protein
VFNYNKWGGGLVSHNNVKIKLEGLLGSFYVMSDEMWEKIFDILGDKIEFYKFKEIIMKKVEQ